MSELTRRFFGTALLTPPARGGNGTLWAPPADVFAKDGDLVVRAELPGLDPDRDIEISWQDGALTIRGERRHEDRSEKDNVYRFESSLWVLPADRPAPAGREGGRHQGDL